MNVNIPCGVEDGQLHEYVHTYLIATQASSLPPPPQHTRCETFVHPGMLAKPGSRSEVSTSAPSSASRRATVLPTCRERGAQ